MQTDFNNSFTVVFIGTSLAYTSDVQWDRYGVHRSFKTWLHRVFFVEPGVKINGVYYRDVLLMQKVLPVIRQISERHSLHIYCRPMAHLNSAVQSVCSDLIWWYWYSVLAEPFFLMMINEWGNVQIFNGSSAYDMLFCVITVNNK